LDPAPGTNRTRQLELAGGEIVFHKPFSGVDVANAIAFGQTDETPPLHEAVAWRFAARRMLARGEILRAGEF